MHDDHVGDGRQQRYRCEITDRIEAGFGIEVRVRQQRHCANQQRVAVRRRFCRCNITDIASGTEPGFGHNLLTQCRRQLSSHQTANGFGAAGEGQDQANRFARIVLCQCVGREQHGEDGQQDCPV